MGIESIVSSYQLKQFGNSPKSLADDAEGIVFTHGNASRIITPGDWSVGSEAHAAGACKPCAWNRKPSGCFKDSSCEFCHVCDAGAIKRKKHAKFARIKEKKRALALQVTSPGAVPF